MQQQYNLIMLVDILFVALVVGLLIAIYKIKFKKDAQNAQRPIIIDAPPRQTARGATWAVAETTQAALPDSSDQEQAEEDAETGTMDMRKKLRKQQKAREKQRRKEALEHHLDQQKQRKEKQDEQQAEKERIEEEKKRKEEQYYKMLSEEEEKKKKAEYDKWKGMFTVETEGKAKESAQEVERKKAQFLDKLCSLLTRNKLSLLQDLSHKFKISTKEVIERIKELEEQKRMKGIFDERGKYMVIQQKEWEAIRNYILARGRIKKTDIMQQCARIIKIPDQDDIDNDILNLIESEGKNQ